MNTNDLKEVIVAKGMHSCVTGENENILWLPIVEISQGRWAGLSKDGEWIVQGVANRVSKLPINGSFMPLLPCLEQNKNEFIKSLTFGLRTNGISEAIVGFFPFEDLIACGLSFGSEYWAQFALKWMDDVAVGHKLTTILLQVEQAKWASQNLRHKVKRALERRNINN